MNKSLPALLFYSKLSIHPPVIIIILFLLLICPVTNTQDGVYPVGQAPISEMKIIPEENFPFAVGTRAFHLISSSPTFQLGKSFMETCNITNIGAPFTMTSPGGLVFRNGVLYTWNQTTPFQLYLLDTVTGTSTLITNIIGVPMSYLTGFCWDGTNIYAVCTNISSSQLLSFNAVTGVCAPIGVPTAACPGAICLFGRMFAGSSLYSYDMVNDELYRWNKTTGVATMLGSAGFMINQGMGACFDGNTAYINANSQLRRWDTTGSNALLCTYSSNPIGIACVPQPPVNIYNPTICRNNVNKHILAENTIYDTILHVGNNFCSLTDINVKIDTINHTWISLMAISIKHNTTSVNLITHRGGSGDNIIGCILNDSAVNPISGAIAPVTGSWQPEQPLNVFNSQSPLGAWILKIYNLGSGDTGVLKAWCITFQYSCPLGGIRQVEVPFNYMLWQNYPNPFNPATTIKYGLPKFGKTRLVVYDVLGKVVAILVDNEFKDAGTYEVQFDASMYSSGIYFYTLESGNSKETKKMLLVK